MVINFKNELAMIKLLEPSCADDANQNCDHCRGKKIDCYNLKIAIEQYFLKKKPVPIRFFDKEYRTMIIEELRNQRELL